MYKNRKEFLKYFLGQAKYDYGFDLTKKELDEEIDKIISEIESPHNSKPLLGIVIGYNKNLRRLCIRKNYWEGNNLYELISYVAEECDYKLDVPEPTNKAQSYWNKIESSKIKFFFYFDLIDETIESTSIQIEYHTGGVKYSGHREYYEE